MILHIYKKKDIKEKRILVFYIFRFKLFVFFIF